MKPIRILSRRSLVRVVTFVTAGLFVAVCFAIGGYALANRYRATLEQSYCRSLDQLGYYADSISTSLVKGIYCGTPAQFLTVVNSISNDAAEAKSNLSALPQSGIDLTNSYKFLSQVGEYSLALTRKVAEGGRISTEEWNNLLALSKYASYMSQEIEIMRSVVMDDDFLNGEVKRTIREENMGNEEGLDAQGAESSGESSEGEMTSDPSFVRGIGDGYYSMEEGFDGYPSLIYDGPFSDHLLNERPKLIENAPEITGEDAAEKAALITGLAISELGQPYEENGTMPSFCFSSGDFTVCITKQGGYPVYMTNGRPIGQARVSADYAIKNAEDFLSGIGFRELTATYHIVSENICTVNFAAKHDGMTVYADLIKVSVALDNGSVNGFDARGYIMNHTVRSVPSAVYSREEGLLSVSPMLAVESAKTVIIPTLGDGEAVCYEYKCRGQNDERILVYINVLNGREEQVLLLIESENGTLTV